MSNGSLIYCRNKRWMVNFHIVFRHSLFSGHCNVLIAELSEQGGDFQSCAGYFTFHRQLLFPDVRYKKSNNLVIFPNVRVLCFGVAFVLLNIIPCS